MFRVEFNANSSYAKIAVISGMTLAFLAMLTYKVEHFINTNCDTHDFERSVYGYVIPGLSEYGTKVTSNKLCDKGESRRELVSRCYLFFGCTVGDENPKLFKDPT